MVPRCLLFGIDIFRSSFQYRDLSDLQVTECRGTTNIHGLIPGRRRSRYRTTECRMYMREMGAICQIGVLTWKPCTFWVQNGSIFGFFRTTFSMIVAQIVVFIVISTFSPFKHLKNSDLSFHVLASCEKVNLGHNALFCSIWTQTWSARKAFLSSKNAPFLG